MQIGPGQAPLSLAILKALGAQSAAPAAAAKAVAGPPATGGAKAAATEAGGEAAATRSLPRGSFLDLRV